MFALGVLAVFLLAGIAAPVLAPHDPFDLAHLDLMDSLLPPVFLPGGQASFPLGTDDQGRDILSGIIWGTRVSLGIGSSATVLAGCLGTLAGLVAGYSGRVADALVMRIADIQLTFPALLVALLIDGVLRVSIGHGITDRLAIAIIVVAIGLSAWPVFARVVRSATMIEAGKDYVLAARLVGRPPLAIMLSHILPNVLGPILVVATVTLAGATIAEATLSFLGVGLPPAVPSLGSMIRLGTAFLFSGEWWSVVFPGAALVLLIWSVNIVGDWFGNRLAFHPR